MTEYSVDPLDYLMKGIDLALLDFAIVNEDLKIKEYFGRAIEVVYHIVNRRALGPGFMDCAFVGVVVDPHDWADSFIADILQLSY